ncbi:type I secretion C-terminal target domain-containing protein [Aerophototrophica crusticola]|uniref:Type I secretion C-terminal target domain-containing protein n=1 Tax=Aerophototrophica crusticola TaxID=1709002 RepID=A0A858R987_9PROT|nr:type I secretion C-terminal target domain-containing protein [Rhodospirillaceae bacterium B3]
MRSLTRLLLTSAALALPTLLPAAAAEGPVVALPKGVRAADIARALGNAPDGARVVLPAGATVKVDRTIEVEPGNRRLTLDLNGATLEQAGKGSIVKVVGGMGPAVEVRTLGRRGDKTEVTFAKLPKGLAVGDWIKVVAEDPLPGGKHGRNPVRLGQATKVLAIDGDTAICAPALHGQEEYRTGLRAAAFARGSITVERGTLLGDGDTGSPLLRVTSVVEPRVDRVWLRRGGGPGLELENTVRARVTEVAAIDLKDDTDRGHFGYGVHSHASLLTHVDGVYGERLRHTTDNNGSTVPAKSPPAGYGGDIGMVVRNAITYDTTASAYSWHSEANLGLYENVLAFGGKQMAVLRGLDNRMVNSGGAGLGRGVQLFQYGDGDGRRLLLDGLKFRGLKDRSVYTTGKVTDSTVRQSRLESMSPNHLGVGQGVRLIGLSDDMAGMRDEERLRLGTDGDDDLAGGRGDDIVWGGPGADNLSGGPGQDRFLYNDVAEGGDTITDFKPGAGGDMVDLGALLVRLGVAPGQDPRRFFTVEAAGKDTRVLVQADGKAVTLATLAGVSAKALVPENIKLTLGFDGSPGETLPPWDAEPTPRPAPPPTAREEARETTVALAVPRSEEPARRTGPDITVAPDGFASVKLREDLFEGEAGLNYRVSMANGQPMKNWIEVRGDTLALAPKDWDKGEHKVMVTAFRKGRAVGTRTVTVRVGGS